MSDHFRSEASLLLEHTKGDITDRVYRRVGAIAKPSNSGKMRYKTLMPPLVKCGLQRSQKMIVLERRQATGHELRASVSRT